MIRQNEKFRHSPTRPVVVAMYDHSSQLGSVPDNVGLLLAVKVVATTKASIVQGTKVRSCQFLVAALLPASFFEEFRRLQQIVSAGNIIDKRVFRNIEVRYS